MLDEDLAELYGVSTKALIQSVKRNPGRFPPDFMFALTKQEIAILRSQTVTSRQFKAVFDAIRELMAPPVPTPKRRIGFVSTDEDQVRKAQKR